MGNLGMGAMLHVLGGGSPKSASDYYGRKIIAAEKVGEDLRLRFDDGKQVRIWDDGQSCCENRYMTCDDDLSKLVGGKLLRIEAKDGPDVDDPDGECHEQCFIEVGTDECFVTLCTHNEHNGYYGGFGLSLDEVK